MNRQTFIGYTLTSLTGLKASNENVFAPVKGVVGPLVMVHGAWHGGWCWKYVKRMLADKSIEVYCPTLTGLGDRHHLNIFTNLDTHIADIVNVIESEELSDVTLVGHSYAGMVITGVADKLRGRIKKLIYVDAFVPQSGQCVFDLLPDERRKGLTETVGADQKIPPLSAPLLGVTNPDDIAWLNRRMTRQSVSTFSQKLSFNDIGDIKRVYIHCTNPPSGSFGQFARRFADDPAWKYVELNTGHDCMITAPQDLASVIILEMES
jgi:pimeloyl-ACP methyl ester carboxylesterase